MGKDIFSKKSRFSIRKLNIGVRSEERRVGKEC